MKSKQVAVPNAATKLVAAGQGATPNPCYVWVYQSSGASLFVGGADVTTTNGLPIATATLSPMFPLVGEALYGIFSAAGPSNVQVLVIGGV